MPLLKKKPAPLRPGDRIRYQGAATVSAGGCLARFTDLPGHLLLIGAAHGLVRKQARQGDPITAAADDVPIGTLLSWTTFRDEITADVALVDVDPAKVAAGTASQRPKPPGNIVRIGDRLTILGNQHAGTVAAIDVDVDLPVTGMDWMSPDPITYAGQIICEPMFTEGGDSGSIVLDDAGCVVGMVVGGRPLVQRDDQKWTSQTVITPIAAILRHPDFGGRTLEIVTPA